MPPVPPCPMFMLARELFYNLGRHLMRMALRRNLNEIIQKNVQLIQESSEKTQYHS